MVLKINAENPQGNKIQQVIDILNEGGIMIYPTDSVYALACLANNKEGLKRIQWIKGTQRNHHFMTIMSPDISELSKLTMPIPNDVFKLMKRNVPGPYTFILRANSKVPKIVQSRRKTIGFRIPENPIALQIISGLNDYLASTSLKVETDQGPEVYYSDPEEIEERFGKLVDVIIDGGILETHLSSVIDCTASVPEIIREGVAPVI